MNIFVSGVAGYLGSVLGPYLVSKGHQVTGVDNYMHGYGSLPSLLSGGVKVHKMDVRDADWLELAKEADIVIPLAALVGQPLCKVKYRACDDVNALAIKRLLEVLPPEKKIIYPNTNSGYGRAYGGRPITEEYPLYPISEYGRSKAEAEMSCLKRGSVVSFRLGTVFGPSPRMRMDLLIHDFTTGILKAKRTRKGTFSVYEKDFSRNFVHIKDVCRAFLWAVESEEAWTERSNVYNLSDQKNNMTKWQLAQKVCEILGVDQECLVEKKGKDPDQRDCQISSDKVIKAGFTFEHSLEEGVRDIAQLASTFNTAELAEMDNKLAAQKGPGRGSS